jgi:hypothetical protein
VERLPVVADLVEVFRERDAVCLLEVGCWTVGLADVPVAASESAREAFPIPVDDPFREERVGVLGERGVEVGVVGEGQLPAGFDEIGDGVVGVVR